MKKTILSDKIKQYVDKVKQIKNIKSDQGAFVELTNTMGEYVEEYKALDPRTVRKWMDGDAYPDVGKIIVLSKIFGCTVDELLKDKEKEIRFNNSLPEWYENLDDKAQKTVFDLLECYRTGEELLDWALNIFFDLFSEKEINEETLEFVEYYSKGKLVSIFFDMDESDDNIIIRTDRYYTRKKMIEKEINRDKRQRQKTLLTDFLSSKNDIKRLDEEIFKVIDISYVESNGGRYSNYYGEIVEDEDTGEKKAAINDNQTTAWNEVGYSVDRESNFLNSYKYKQTPKQFIELKKRLEIQREELLNRHFSGLLNSFVKPVREHFTYIGFAGGYEKDDDALSKYYYEVEFLLLIDEDDIEKILLANYQKNIQGNIEKINQAIEKKFVAAQELSSFWLKYHDEKS